jgi:nitrogen fixation-related uncharacterized protein
LTTFFWFFLLYLGLGVVMTAVLFWWAVRNDQFGDQKRARYLPLVGIEPEEAEKRQKWPKEIVVTVIVASIGMAMLLAFVLVIAVTE